MKNLELIAIKDAINVLEHLDDVQTELNVGSNVREKTNYIINILIEREEELLTND